MEKKDVTWLEEGIGLVVEVSEDQSHGRLVLFLGEETHVLGKDLTASSCLELGLQFFLAAAMLDRNAATAWLLEMIRAKKGPFAVVPESGQVH